MTTRLPDPYGFGADISCAADMTPLADDVAGLQLFAEELVRAIQTPTGSLDDPEYGIDARRDIGRSLTEDELDTMPRRYELAFERDDRVLEARATIVALTDYEMTLDFRVVTQAGPFRFTAAVSQAEVLIKEAARAAD